MRQVSFVLAVLALLMTFSSTPAHANLIDDASKWVHDSYNKARDEGEKLASAAEHAAKQIAQSAQYISQEAMKQTTQMAKQAASSIEDAAKQMNDLINNLTEINKTCQGFLNSVTSKGTSFVSEFPKLPPMPNAPEFLMGFQCKQYAVNGFSCGIFPYLDGIAKAIAQGTADTKRLAQYVDHAYKSSPCTKVNLTDRSMCALIMGIAKMGDEAMSCAANVIVDLNNSGGGMTSISGDAEKMICTKLGEFGFGFAADQLALGAAAGEDIKKLIKFAQVYRTALKLEHAVVTDEHIRDVCKNGAKATSSGKSYRAPETVDTYADILSGTPGKHLLLMKDLTSNMCMDGYGAHTHGDRQVQVYGCHGHTNQRWSFYEATRPDIANKGFYYIKNDRYGTCIHETPNGMYLKPCNQNYNEQLFTIHKKKTEIVRKNDDGTETKETTYKNTGMLINLHTGKCMGLNTTSLRNELRLHGYPCDDPSTNAIWYVNDPAKSLLDINNLGAHLNVYAYPESPFCLAMNSAYQAEIMPCSSAPEQLWSFHTVTNKYGKFVMLQNDKHGPGSCLQVGDKGQGETMTLGKCNSDLHSQLFTINPESGQLKNFHNGMCVNIYGARKSAHTKIISWPCESGHENMSWYKASSR